MANDREYDQRPEAETGNKENTGTGRKEQFNELSELSLEERMAVADRMGIPVENAGEAAATGAMIGSDDTAGDFDGRTEENSNEGSPDR